MATDYPGTPTRTTTPVTGTPVTTGTTGMTTATTGDIVQATQVVTPRDRVRWGPILAGLLTALGTFVLLSLLATAIGVQGVNVAREGDEAARNIGIVSAIIGLLSFLLGGFIAARTSAVRGRWNGLLNGFLVWALGLLLLLALAALGIGGLLGDAGDLFGQYRAAGQPRPEGVSARQVNDAIRNGSVGAFLSLALPAAAAAIGGWLGAREDVPHADDDRERRGAF